MAARPHAIPCIHSFVDPLMWWVETPGNTTLDVPFIIAGCTECIVIFYLHCHMEVPDDGPVHLRNNVISWRLWWYGVEDAIAAGNQHTKDKEAEPHPPRRPTQNERLDDDETLSSLLLGSDAMRKEGPHSGQKRKVD